jgi:lysophospholipid acyltransferase (LPLAT)-like uncharacterized protein
MSIRKKIKHAIANSRPVLYLVYQFLNLYSKTIRVRFENCESIFNHLNENGRVLIGSWHQRFFAGFYLPKKFQRPVCIMISQSRDGDFIADIVRRIGWMPARGSSSRGGKEAMKAMIDGIIETGIGGHIVDGPTGPPRIIKPGLIALAQQSGAAICNAYVYYENPWILNSWDRFMIPKPFSRVLLRFGKLEFIPEEMDAGEFEDIRQRIEKEMIEEYEKEDFYWQKR